MEIDLNFLNILLKFLKIVLEIENLYCVSIEL